MVIVSASYRDFHAVHLTDVCLHPINKRVIFIQPQFIFVLDNNCKANLQKENYFDIPQQRVETMGRGTRLE